MLKILNLIKDLDLHSNLVIFKSLSVQEIRTLEIAFTFQSGDIQI